MTSNKHHTWYIISLVLGDITALVAGFHLALFLRSHLLLLGPFLSTDFTPSSVWWLLVPYGLLVPLVAWQSGLYKYYHLPGPLLDLLKLFKVTITTAIAILALTYLAKAFYVSRAFLIILACTTFMMLALERMLARYILRYAAKQGYHKLNTLIVGISQESVELAQKLSVETCVLGFIQDTYKQEGLPKLPSDYKILGSLKDLPEVLQQNVVDEVYILAGKHPLKVLREVTTICALLGVHTKVLLKMPLLEVPQQEAHLRVFLDKLDSHRAVLTLSPAPHNQWGLFVKRLIDVLVALSGLILAAPILLVAALGIKLTSKGPVIFRQKRCGKGGRVFTLYKLRTMYQDADAKKQALWSFNEQTGPVFKMKNDPRVTPLGRLLRKTSIDELPQLWNVLRGDMSIVGPRPPLPDEVAQYEPWQRRRLALRPGLTCLWQISGRSQIPFERWIKLDLEYIDKWSLWLDLKIILKTIPAILLGKGAS